MIDYPLEKYTVQLLIDAIRERDAAIAQCHRRLADLGDRPDGDPISRHTLVMSAPAEWRETVATVGRLRHNNLAWIREYEQDRIDLIAELRTRKDGPAVAETLLLAHSSYTP